MFRRNRLPRITAAELKKKIAENKQHTLLDVRTNEEWKDTGIIPGPTFPPSPIFPPIRPIIRPSIPSFPPFTPPFDTKSLILNIETLGIDPKEARIVSISYQDPNIAGAQPIVILLEDELEILKEFLRVFTANNYNEIIGYNIAFDHRFIIAKCMFYQLPCKEFVDADLFDLMQIMKQIKRKFVFNFNKSFSLSSWSEYFFDFPKRFPDSKMMELYRAGVFNEVEQFSADQITRLFL
ncbi:MAG: ribonuclease H-like domain-containing protein, partial [Candidatus Heimdallarchaeota archaeon]|nr:ribonuclease H-like domain-containing protein [Candidatus Heimdallarchaeota archaeon]